VRRGRGPTIGGVKSGEDVDPYQSSMSASWYRVGLREGKGGTEKSAYKRRETGTPLYLSECFRRSNQVRNHRDKQKVVKKRR